MIFNYVDDLSQLTDGSNTIPVQAGINAAFSGPTANFISIPNTSNISSTSNVEIAGVWMFQTNGRPFITTPGSYVRGYSYSYYVQICTNNNSDIFKAKRFSWVATTWPT